MARTIKVIKEKFQSCKELIVSKMYEMNFTCFENGEMHIFARRLNDERVEFGYDSTNGNIHIKVDREDWEIFADVVVDYLAENGYVILDPELGRDRSERVPNLLIYKRVNTDTLSWEQLEGIMTRILEEKKWIEREKMEGMLLYWNPNINGYLKICLYEDEKRLSFFTNAEFGSCTVITLIEEEVKKELNLSKKNLVPLGRFKSKENFFKSSIYSIEFILINAGWILIDKTPVSRLYESKNCQIKFVFQKTSRIIYIFVSSKEDSKNTIDMIEGVLKGNDWIEEEKYPIRFKFPKGKDAGLLGERLVKQIEDREEKCGLNLIKTESKLGPNLVIQKENESLSINIQSLRKKVPGVVILRENVGEKLKPFLVDFTKYLRSLGFERKKRQEIVRGEMVTDTLKLLFNIQTIDEDSKRIRNVIIRTLDTSKFQYSLVEKESITTFEVKTIDSQLGISIKLSSPLPGVYMERENVSSQLLKFSNRIIREAKAVGLHQRTVEEEIDSLNNHKEDFNKNVKTILDEILKKGKLFYVGNESDYDLKCSLVQMIYSRSIEKYEKFGKVEVRGYIELFFLDNQELLKSSIKSVRSQSKFIH